MTRSRSAARRRWRLWGGVVAVVVLLGAAYLTWRVLQVRHDLLEARHQATELRSAIARGDDAGAQRALARFTARTDSAQAHTNAFWWRVADHAPFVGDDARAIRISAAAGSTVGHELTPVVHQVGADLPRKLAPHHGRIDLQAVSGLAPTVSTAEASLAGALTQLDAVDRSGLLGFVRRPFDGLLGQLRDAHDALAAARRTTQVLPSMLGRDGPRRYLVMFDNNAEIRANGGMPGAWAIVEADHGRITLVRQGATAPFDELTSPIVPLTKAERAIYDTQLGAYFQDTGFTPDYPRTAYIASALWRHRFAGHLDGVMSTDTVTLGYLLGATGPIHAPGGVELTSTNASDELLNNVYRRLSTNEAQDAFFQGVASLVFHKLTTGISSPTSLVQALARSVDQGRTYVHSFHPAEQSILDPSRIAGRLDLGDSVHPQLGIYLNDATGAKMSYYLRTKVEQRSVSCSDGRQRIEGSMDFHMLVPQGPLNEFITGTGQYGTPKGQQTVLARIYGPVGGQLTGFSVDGESFPPDITVDRGRAVSTVALRLKAGQTVHLVWTTRTGPGQTGSTTVTTTPMLTGGNVTTVPSAC